MFMRNMIPEIGLATHYNVRTSSSRRKKRELTWDMLFSEPSQYPTVVIPIVKSSKKCTHAFTVVHDLIFDSISPMALKLQAESVNWIFNNEEVEIHRAYRFNMKWSPPGHKCEGVYKQTLVLHWKHSDSNRFQAKDDDNEGTDDMVED